MPEPMTPLRAIYDLLVLHGYVDNQTQFTDLLRIGKTNVSSYMASKDKPYRVSPRLDTLALWCWVISTHTNIRLQMIVDGATLDLSVEVTGYSKDGKPIDRAVIPTNFSSTFKCPVPSWHGEWVERPSIG
jgi:hypothetical protein